MNIKRYTKVNFEVSTNLRYGFGGQECPRPHILSGELEKAPTTKKFGNSDFQQKAPLIYN